ncbi:unnamed protein product, partial [Chrysoparadoxa australica]
QGKLPGGVAGTIRHINASKERSSRIKQEIAAATNNVQMHYQDDGALVKYVMKDATSMAEQLYPATKLPSNLELSCMVIQELKSPLLEEGRHLSALGHSIRY